MLTHPTKFRIFHNTFHSQTSKEIYTKDVLIGFKARNVVPSQIYIFKNNFEFFFFGQHCESLVNPITKYWKGNHFLYSHSNLTSNFLLPYFLIHELSISHSFFTQSDQNPLLNFQTQNYYFPFKIKIPHPFRFLILFFQI